MFPNYLNVIYILHVFETLTATLNYNVQECFNYFDQTDKTLMRETMREVNI